jgi:hypothetical protein
MMGFVLRCTECREKFKWLGDKFPDECPICHAHIGHDRADDDVVMPFVSRRKIASADKTYRAMEAGSEQRMQLAAELTGEPASEFSGLKITDMRDNMRAGDMAAIPVDNAVTRHMAATGQGGFVGADGSGYSGSVQSGPFPNAGAKMRTTLQQHHANLSHGSAVSDNPGLETRQPGYRRRG